MNTPKAVADELLALARDKDGIKKALVESGAEVGEDDGFSSFPEKIRAESGSSPQDLQVNAVLPVDRRSSTTTKD